jgi:hypothetical protein
MIDLSIPVMLHLKHGDDQTYCWAKLVRDQDRLFAEPFLPSQEMQPYRPRRLELSEQYLTLPPNNDSAERVYRYPIIDLSPQSPPTS